MRKKPEKPVPEVKQYQDTIDNFDTVGDLVRYLKGWDISLNEVSITERYDWPEGDMEVVIKWEMEETKEEFQKRLNKYEKDLEKYNQWYEDNKEEIEEGKRKKKKEEQEQVKKRIKRLTKKLEKEKEKLNGKER